REQNGSDSRISCIRSVPWHHNRARCICFHTAQKTLYKLGLYFNNLLGLHTVRFTMNTLCRFSIWCMAETKNFARFLIEPVFAVLDAIFPLCLHVLRVSLRDIFRSGSLRKVVNVHV